MALVEFRHGTARLSGHFLGDEKVYYSLERRQMARAFVIPANPNTRAQKTVRAVQTLLTGQFSNLSRTIVDGWDALGKSFIETDRLGRKYSYRGIQAFLAVNTHRLLAGQTALTSPPRFRKTAPPLWITGVAPGTGGTLEITVRHFMDPGAGFWRVRLTPPLASPARLATRNELRSATVAFADSYLAIMGSPQTFRLATKFAYKPGSRLGIEILGLSDQYVPGRVLFDRRATVA